MTEKKNQKVLILTGSLKRTEQHNTFGQFSNILTNSALIDFKSAGKTPRTLNLHNMNNMLHALNFNLAIFYFKKMKCDSIQDAV